ncbi:hypothetical protein Prudu_1159S000200, partial [Prunus dulcis]
NEEEFQAGSSGSFERTSVGKHDFPASSGRPELMSVGKDRELDGGSNATGPWPLELEAAQHPLEVGGPFRAESGYFVLGSYSGCIRLKDIYESAEGYVQNRTRPEGCIAERYIAEEVVEFCTQHLSDVITIGVPSSQKWEFQSHYQATCDPHQDCLSKFRKRTKWLQDKHNSTFIQWLRFKVQSELEEDNHGIRKFKVASSWSKHGSAII